MNVTHLECAACGKKREAGKIHNLCECGGPLLVRYDLPQSSLLGTATILKDAPGNMWRYLPVLPRNSSSIVSLGEGMTPLIETRRLGARLGAGTSG